MNLGKKKNLLLAASILFCCVRRDGERCIIFALIPRAGTAPLEQCDS